ncbi:hypothetical protein NPIL_9301 [Nephila pilipes]|uniref:Uncharacterized protein n=1 Tax=Nephila pilipes TaxID=299642 RepID=A0A8X6T5B3_NEPPI|nr:hypothetical protein NPIL_9301 [Nephila pilipes]
MLFYTYQVFSWQVYASGSEEAACKLFGDNAFPFENPPSENHFATGSLSWFQVKHPKQRPSFERSSEYTACQPEWVNSCAVPWQSGDRAFDRWAQNSFDTNWFCLTASTGRG